MIVASCVRQCRRANPIRDTVPSRESHALNEPSLTFYLHFLFNELPFMFHKNCCCFLSSTALFLTSQTSENLVVKKNKQLSFPQDIICRSHKPRIIHNRLRAAVHSGPLVISAQWVSLSHYHQISPQCMGRGQMGAFQRVEKRGWASKNHEAIQKYGPRAWERETYFSQWFHLS